MPPRGGVVGVEDDRVGVPFEGARLGDYLGAGDVYGADDLEMWQSGAQEREVACREGAVQLQRRHAEIAAQLDGCGRVVDIGDGHRRDEGRQRGDDAARRSLGEPVVKPAGQAHSEAQRVGTGRRRGQRLVERRHTRDLYAHRHQSPSFRLRPSGRTMVLKTPLV